jgi:hypothetical protein
MRYIIEILPMYSYCKDAPNDIIFVAYISYFVDELGVQFFLNYCCAL